MEHLDICLDSDVLIDHLRANPEVVKKIKKFEDEGSALFTTTINSFELYYGAFKTAKKERNIQAVEGLLSRLILLPLDNPSSKISAKILKDLEVKGHMVEFRDALIAGIVIANNLSLLTGNIKHFGKIEDLKVL
ncbi:MAG: type II toxin-antitoxin system VapC family toxin [Thermodesulfobacteriota bacterium]